MGRNSGFIYGVLAYMVFFVTFLYIVGFVGGFLVPKDINTGAEGPFILSLIINSVLLSIFALQHTIMARPGFKRVWTQVIPQYIERSTYVWLSSIALILLVVFWQPMPAVIWDARGTPLGYGLSVLFWAGWVIVLTSTFMIDHFDLFGLKQVYMNLNQRNFNQMGFQKRLYYRLVRHPIMTGFIISFWAAPHMTVGHLLFSIATTLYIYIAVRYFEERDLVATIGPDYIEYQKEVGMLIPGVGKK